MVLCSHVARKSGGEEKQYQEKMEVTFASFVSLDKHGDGYLFEYVKAVGTLEVELQTGDTQPKFMWELPSDLLALPKR